MRSLYLHIPFCEKKCLFCSFVVSIEQKQRINKYLECLEKEICNFKKNQIQTIYVGGGTPTLLNEKQLIKLKEIIDRNFVFKKDAEITIEANPEGLSIEKVQCLKDCGFNRLSIGIQSLNNKYLQYLGRCHDRDVALKAFENARKVGFNNINLDLMYSFPDQSKKEILQDVHDIASLGSEHLSLYTLTVEKNSRFYAQNLTLQDEQLQAEYYNYVCEALSKEGFKQYEISNFSKKGFESKHNLNYWQGGNYIGVGVGAHANDSGRYSWNNSNLFDYMKRIENNETVEEGYEELPLSQRLIERILFGLRMNKGVSVEDQEQALDYQLDEHRKGVIKSLVEGGFLSQKNKMLMATDKGRVVLDEISAKLF